MPAAKVPVGAPHVRGGWWQTHRDSIQAVTRRAMLWAFLGMGLGMGSYLAFLTMARYPIIRPIYRYAVVPGIAIALTGMVGAFMAGTSVFVGALVYSHQKGADSRLARITMFMLSGLVMAAGLALLSQGLPGNTSTIRTLLARFVIGAGLLGTALVPLKGLTEWQRAAVAAVGGFAVFGLIRELEGIFFDMPILWQLAAGGGAAAGLTLGLNPSSWPARWGRTMPSKAQSSTARP
ncbi:MAG TPA: hypothetical protein VER55_09945 [Ardenticatenaceae bacterium]|nr:hypothetical protein [Ardenticatenaceae bacterium]